MAQEHRLYFISRTVYMIRGFLAIVIGLLTTLIIATNIDVHLHSLIFLTIDALLTILLFYLSKNWYKGQLLVRCNNREIQLSSYFPLFRRSREYSFHWDELKDIFFSDTRYFIIFVVKDQKKKVAFAFDYGDEFTRFEQMLNKQIYKFKQNGLIKINRKTTIYETKLGIVTAVILGLIMIA